MTTRQLHVVLSQAWLLASYFLDGVNKAAAIFVAVLWLVANLGTKDKP